MTTKERRDLYEEVSAAIIEQLDQGHIPWAKPWRTGVDPHRNPVTGTVYRGINPMLLEMGAMRGGFADRRWVTFKQAKGAGGTVRAGARGTMIVFYRPIVIKDEETGEKRSIFMLRHYTVFNVEQIDGLKLEELVEYVPEPQPAADAIVDGYLGANGGPTFRHGGDSAHYNPARDLVQVPPREAFASDDTYFSTVFHEAAHSTGHGSRLARREITELGAFGDEAYGREELTAEMTAAMLCGVAGLETLEHSAGYIQHWRDAIAADNRLVVFAAQRAQKAADWVLGIKPKHGNGEGA